TFGGPDIAGTLAAVATVALNAVWYQKWFVHLRPRPEAIGGIVHLIKTGQGSYTDVRPSAVILNSKGLQQSFNKYRTWLLSQAFPEGSPAHPSYPTGHGTVGGACITVLKFFFDGDSVIPKPVVPTSDGLSLVPYTGPDAGQLTVNGELNKLGHNVSFGHGIHAGIHWRSDTDTSLLLGEAVALSFLNDRAKTYNEPFTVSITKFDGTTATISNQ
ncbi:MAG TPA: vanadium-dependent haloperoxidase, partial [Terracidiphilus sp.]